MSVEITYSPSPLQPPSSHCSRRRRALGPRHFPSLPKPLALANDAAFIGSGLKTPPLDDMSTAYHPAIPAYDGHAIHGYPSSGLAHASRSRVIMDEGRGSQHYRYSTQQAPPISASQARSSSSIANPQPDPTPRRSTRATSPVQEVAPATKQNGEASRHNSEMLIYHSLQIPKCISPDGGNLSDFAAQMTCLFWFEAADNLKRAESIRTRPANAPIPRLPTLAKPYDQFRKWVHNVLSTTQVTQNVIFLALLFIYRLKMSTPQIKGRAGSEYRLLTVALMLGNKFLDDNTYTNKTWAEVSCFAVQEIHVMEVEFLSNMRYNLLASKDEWEDWLVKLACFHEYYQRALQMPASPIRNPSPTNTMFSSPAPSPTAATLPAIPDITPYTSAAMAAYSPSLSHSKTLAAYQANATSPLSAKPSVNLASRKRCSEDDPVDHPAKRQFQPRNGQGVPISGTSARPSSSVDTARLPMPQLAIVTNQARNLASTYAAANGYAPQIPGNAQHVVSLPPLQPGIRAISTVYPSNTATTVAQQPAVSAPVGTPIPTTPYSMAQMSGHGTMSFGTPTKHHGSMSLAPYGSSPLVEHIGSGPSGVHTPISHTPMSNSPSVYLQQRASPYKPIRHVNTLLYPPPSASLDQYHLSVPVQPNQMHYQPLGRRNDVRTGVVPEFIIYNRGQHHLQHPGSHGAPQGHYPS
ncbi:hypothetical protein HIM_08547 [Hirsutella minnesotensis 3608]|uniref:Cyclin N-terminal domain-containing protein n=1 Tax=Hirsutella minnesotensis 3608 TaxID=1043627 RepID=A0A0F7ZY97_9HYPO|nr:hypothetical protein HIM_08547 [Hirsutella minnesotensis 3608]